MNVRAAAVAGVAGRPAVAMTTAGRLARASTFAGSSVCLAVAAHTAADGHRPSSMLVVCAFGLLTRIAYGLAGRERRSIAVLAGIGLTQLALHVTFALTSHGAGMAGEAVLADGMTMAVAHVSTAALVAAMLAMAERGLWNAASLRAAVAGARARTRAAAVLLRAVRWFAATLVIPVSGPMLDARPSARRHGSDRSAGFMPPVAVAGALFVRAGRRRGPPLVRSAKAA
ncbi:hypothetical protein [Frankia sp. Cas4]|uniref:hypothetical protein n=1 Tax=Frankia sp. Cas4 TaxID=3073927 RepID=UPI002AD3CC61|nr:hypothetical protein [Frankia sp. Cas4]